MTLEAIPASLARRTVIGASWLVLWRFVTRVLGFASTLILARLLVPADFGLVVMATTFAAAVDSLSQIGLQEALVRHPANDRKLFNTAFTLQAGRAVITSGLVVLAAPAAAYWFNEPRIEAMLVVLAAASLVFGFENIGIIEFRREMRFDMQFRLLLIPRLLQLVTTIPLAIMTESYWALVLGTVVGKVSHTALTYVLHPYRPRLALAGWREFAGFSLWTWAACLSGLVWTRCDPFVLGPAIGPAQLGLYLLSFEVAILAVSELIAPAADALFAGFASAQKQGTNTLQQALTIASALLLLIMPTVIAISCASGYVVAALLGPRWGGAQPLIAILAWQCVFAPFSHVATAVLVANSHVRRNFLGVAVGAAVKLAALVTVISFTSRMDVIAVTIVVCVGVEAGALLLQLRATGEARMSSMVGGVTRAVLATAATVPVLHQVGFASQSVALSSVAALLYCALAGIVALVVFWTVVVLLWLASGRPAGPEALLLNLARTHLYPNLARRLAPGRA